MLFPHTRSRRLELRPASADDHGQFVRTLLQSGIESVNATRSRRVSMNSCAAFLVARRTTGDVLGFATLHGLDPAGHLRAGLYLDPARSRLGVGAEGIYLMTNYAFAMFPIDKLLGQTTEATFGAVGLGPGDDTAKAVLAEHLYFRGRHWDLHTFEMTREEWEFLVDADLGNVLGDGVSWHADPHRPCVPG